MLEADVTVRPDLALDPLSPLPGVSRQRGQGGPLPRLEERAAALAVLGHGGIVEAVELAADGRVHGVDGEEGLVAQRQQDAGLHRPDARLDQPLVGGPPLACRQHRDPVMERELPVGGIEPDIVAVGIVHARLEVVDDPTPRGAAEVLERSPVRHRPVAHRLVGHRLGVDQVRMRKHRDEDLHVRLGAAGAKGERLAGEVRHPVQRRAHSRSASAPGRRSCPGAPSGARRYWL